MYKRRKISKLGKKTSHRKLMIRGQLQSLIKYGHVTTTTPKARVLVQSMELLFSTILSSEGFERVRRISAFKVERDTMTSFVDYVVAKRPKLSIVKVGIRPGDNSEKSLVKIVGWKEEGKKKAITTKKEVKETKEAKTEVKPKAAKNASKISKVFTASKERSRSRSGL